MLKATDSVTPAWIGVGTERRAPAAPLATQAIKEVTMAASDGLVEE